MKIERDTSSLRAAADDGGAVTVHQNGGMGSERPRQRMPLLLLDDQKIGVAEFVLLIPERHVQPARGAEMKHRNDRLAGDAERHHRRRVVMADRPDVAARLIDTAVNDAFGIEVHFGRPHRFGIERVFQDIVRLDQKRRARARQEIAAGIGRMAHADVAESVEHAFMGEDTVRERQFLDQIGHLIGHVFPLLYGHVLAYFWLAYQAVNASTLKARTGRWKPLSSSSPIGSMPTIVSTAS